MSILCLKILIDITLALKYTRPISSKGESAICHFRDIHAHETSGRLSSNKSKFLFPKVYRNKIYYNLYNHWLPEDILWLRCLRGKCWLSQHMEDFPATQQINQTNSNEDILVSDESFVTIVPQCYLAKDTAASTVCLFSLDCLCKYETTMIHSYECHCHWVMNCGVLWDHHNQQVNDQREKKKKEIQPSTAQHDSVASVCSNSESLTSNSLF